MLKICIKFINRTNSGSYIRAAFLFVFNIFVTFNANAQYFSIGNNPGRVKWSYLTSNNYRVIYPTAIDSAARSYIYLLEELREPVLSPLGVSPKRIDVILHPFSSKSNGLVSWAPSRMEFITTPPLIRDFSFNWEKSLVLHELRHTGQMSMFTQGVFKPLGWLIGEQSAAIGAALFMSRWKLEGDAVITETEFTSAGRGRDPDHLIYFRAAFSRGDFRSWVQWTQGSLKEYVPDVYSFGYLFNSYLRFTTQDTEITGKITKYAIKRFYNPFAEKSAYKKFTGYSREENFNRLKETLSAKWRIEDSLREPFSEYSYLNRANKSYTSYLYPISKGGDKFYAVKRDLDRIDRLIALDSLGNESFLKYMSALSSPIRVKQDRVFWTEYTSLGRWELESFSDLFEYNISTGKTQRLTTNKRLSSPNLSNNGISYIWINNLPNLSQRVEIVDSESMSVQMSISPPKGVRALESVLWEDTIYLLVKSDLGYLLYCRKLGDLEWSEPLFRSKKEISSINYYQQRVWFISHFEDVKDIYSVDVESWCDLRRHTNSRFGVNGLFIDEEEGKFIFSDFTYNGYSIVSEVSDSLLWKRAHKVGSSYFNSIESAIGSQAGFLADTLNIGDVKVLSGGRYNKSKNIFRVHSWAPLYYNIDNIKSLSYESVYDIVSPGFILYSQNSLSTAFGMLGYSWQQGFHSGHLSFRYTGLYPVLETKINVNTRDRVRYTLQNDHQGRRFQKRDTIVNSPYFDSYLRVYLPLRYSSGGWSRGIIPKLMYRFTNDSFFSYRRESYNNYHYLNTGVTIYKILNTAQRDIFPRAGAGAEFQLSTVPFSGENFGTVAYLSTFLYAPGVTTGHGIRVMVAAQKQFYEGKNYLMSNIIRFPYGYDDRYSREALTVQFEYAMPLYTGDLSLSPLLYVKRVQLIPYLDGCINQTPLRRELLYSGGGSLLAEVNLFGISYPVTLGIKCGITAEKSVNASFVFKTPL